MGYAITIPSRSRLFSLTLLRYNVGFHDQVWAMILDYTPSTSVLPNKLFLVLIRCWWIELPFRVYMTLTTNMTKTTTMPSTLTCDAGCILIYIEIYNLEAGFYLSSISQNILTSLYNKFTNWRGLWDFYPNKYFLKRIVSLISSKTYFFKSWIQSHYCNLWVTFQFKRAILIAQFKTVHINIIVWSKVSFFQLSSEIS